jgi:soluble lytic murein transglycosylase-like protein
MCFRLAPLAVLLAFVGAIQAGAREDLTPEVQTVVRADRRTGRLVRRVVVPENIVKPVVVTAKAFPSSSAVKPSLPSEPVKNTIEQISREQGVDPLLVQALIHVESRYNPYAISPKGAEGLMQLIPSTAKEMGVRNSFDSRQNIEGGVKYLRQLMGRFDDLRHVLAAYNAGPAAVARWQGIPPYTETQDYVYKVGKRYGELRRSNPQPQASAQPAESVQPPEPEYRPLESYLDSEGRLHLRTR